MKVEPEIGDPGGSFGHGLEPQKLNSNYYTWTDWDFDYPDEICKRYWQIITIRPGMKLSILNYYIDRDIEIYFEMKRPPLVFGYVLSGDVTTYIGSGHIKKECIRSESGMSMIQFRPHICGVKHVPKNQKICMVGLMITPHILGKILNHGLKDVSQELCTVINGDQNKTFHTYETITPITEVAVRQIVNCPYEGDTRRIYLESKALELIAIKFAGNNKGELPEFSKSADKEKIRQARDILIEDLENTPSLQELAKSVGLTHTRLNRGFRKIYGLTVFNYLRAYRLKYARMLLQEEDMNVAEVAYTSGFSSPSHFATDFFRCYGVQPKLYRKQIF